MATAVSPVSDADERIIAKASLEAAEEQLKSLCATHAGTFVAVQRRGQALELALKDLLKSITAAAEPQIAVAVQALEQEHDEKGKSLAALSENHRVRRRTLLQHSSLLELLELPSLMDACVRSNMYEEALSIAAFANTLERRHTEKNEVVMKVISQVRSRQMDLRRLLLHRLKSHVTMPQCLEIVTALRRLNSIDLERRQGEERTNLESVHSTMELGLQVDFLEARDAWLESIPSPTATSTTTSSFTTSNNISARANEQFLDTIERYRTRVFEIATQYNAIFRAQANTKQSTSMSVLCMWATRRINSFLSQLSLHLDRVEDSAVLRDTLEASIFFATSMGRLGIDFTAQLPPLFESKMHTLVTQCWKEGINQLQETLKICREAGVASPLINQTTSTDTTDADDNDNGDVVSTTTEAEGPLQPPRQLMKIPPLARLLNSFLNGLNELRRCLLPGIFMRLRISLQQTLSEVKTILGTNNRAVSKPGLRGDAKLLREVSSQMIETMTKVVEPFVCFALEKALGNDVAAAKHLEKMKEKKPEIPSADIEEEPTPLSENKDDNNDNNNTEVMPTEGGEGENPIKEPNEEKEEEVVSQDEVHHQDEEPLNTAVDKSDD